MSRWEGIAVRFLIAIGNSLAFYGVTKGFHLTSNEALTVLLFVILYFIILRTEEHT